MVPVAAAEIEGRYVTLKVHEAFAARVGQGAGVVRANCLGSDKVTAEGLAVRLFSVKVRVNPSASTSAGP